MKAHDINIGRNSVLVSLERGVVLARLEPDVVGREVALELQIVINDLFEHVLLRPSLQSDHFMRSAIQRVG